MRKGLLLFMMLVCLSFSCGSPSIPDVVPDPDVPKQEETKDDDRYGIDLRAFSDVLTGQTLTVSYSGPQVLTTSDFIVFKSASSYAAQVESVSGNSFTVTLPAYLTSGTYTVSVLAGGRTITVGRVDMKIAANPDLITVAPSTTVYGRVLCGGNGLEGVVVSDGLITAKTDVNGVYQLSSAKKQGYIFVVLPSGYAAPVKGVFPQIHAFCKESPDVPERLDFSLQKDGNQSRHTVLVMGDFQLCRRYDDTEQVKPLLEELSSYAADNAGKKFFGMLLGDLTWDTDWVSSGFGLPEFAEVMKGVRGMTFHSVIGNHDYELEAAGDMATAAKYKQYIGPTYYSFNYGRIHYICLDSVVCTNDGNGSRSYDRKIDADQLSWLDADLSYVDKSTQVVLMTHVNRSSISNFSELMSHFAGFSRPVHLFTAHTHTMSNSDKTSEPIPYFEHNSATPSGCLWETGSVTPGINLCKDGTPAGYTIFSVDGDDVSWRYKSVGRSIDYQFRVYDRRAVALNSALLLPEAHQSNRTNFDSAASGWADYGTGNKIFINVWNYDPSWKIEVMESGRPLTVTKVSRTDPYYIWSYLSRYYDSPQKKEAATSAGSTGHFFEVSAESPTSTLEVTVTDRFGNMIHESFSRPKPLTDENYPWRD